MSTETGPTVCVDTLPVEVAKYKEKGEWTSFLTELPTVELNAFLKRSKFTAKDIASLKKERRKRKCNIYTRRFREKRSHEKKS